MEVVQNVLIHRIVHGGGGKTVLGSKLNNPYSLTNMQAAYDELFVTKSGDSVTLTATDLYVRFLPKDSTEFYLLKHDLQLELFDRPLDYDIVEAGCYYHDPSLPDDAITWQYTTVKTDFAFPQGILYEILEECYIPEDDSEEDADTDDIPIYTGDDEEEETATRSTVAMSQAEALENRALARAGFMENDTKGLLSAVTGHRPSGKMTVYDDKAGKYVPVSGVKIRCNIVVKWSTTFTNASGEYRMDSKFVIGPYYEMVFENKKGFTLWHKFLCFSASNHGMGWHNRKGYSENIGRGDGTESWFQATVNNAAYDHYVWCEKTGISKPPADLKIWAFTKRKNINSSPMLRRINSVGIQSNNLLVSSFINQFIEPITTTLLASGALPDVTICLLNEKGKSKTYDELYRTTRHELAHASHFSQVGPLFWTDYVNYIVTYGRDSDSPYGSDGHGKNSGVCAVGEMWGYAVENLVHYERYGEKKPIRNYWFKPKIIQDLIFYNILTPKQIYVCLESDIRSSKILKNKLLRVYPQKAAQITDIFETYDQ